MIPARSVAPEFHELHTLAETLLSVVFVTDLEGRLLHACDSSLRQLRLSPAKWRNIPWHSNLGEHFGSIIDAWNSRDTSLRRFVFCNTSSQGKAEYRVVVLAFEKSADNANYIALMKVVAIPLHPTATGSGHREVAVFSLPERRVAWLRFDGSGQHPESPSVGGWDEWFDRILPEEREEVKVRLNRLVVGDYDRASVKCRAKVGYDRIEFFDCQFQCVLRDVSGEGLIVRAEISVTYGAGKASLALHLGHHLLDHVQESVVATDLNGIIHYWGKGAEKLYGWTSEEALGKQVTMIVPECEVRNEHVRMQKVVATGSWSGRYRQARKDGSTFLASSHISLVRNDDGHPIGFVGIDNDISDWFTQQRKITEMQSSLASAQWLSIRGELLAGCCHELCQPVFAIQNIIGAVRRTLDMQGDPERVKALLAMCSEEVTRAAEISEKLRGYATRPQQTLERQDPRKLLVDCGAIGRLHAELAGVQFEIQADENPCEIECDEIQLRHVVINLLRNAFDSLSECDLSVKRVLLRGMVRDSKFVVSVIDNGIGVAEHAREKLFTPFFTTKRNGTGIGLAMCRSIVENHSGSLDLIYSAPYEGAHFEVALPLYRGTNSLQATDLELVSQ
jgi:two-component system sensor kinase FixL